MGTRALGEDVEDQAGAGQYPAGQQALKVALLAGAECVVEDDNIGLVLLHRGVDLLGLALADEQPRFGGRTGRDNGGHRLGSGRAYQFGEFLKILLVGTGGKVHVDQDGPFTTIGAFEQPDTP